ncbi:hypothetical protein ABK040_016425 [Willaertia magna]
MLPNSRQYGNVTPTMQMIHNDQRILPIGIPNNSNEAIQYQQQPIIYNNNKLSHNASPYPIMYNINNPQNNNQQPLQNQKFMQSIGQATSGNSTTTSTTTLTDQDIKNKLKQNFKYNCFKTPKQKVTTTTSNTIRTVTPIPISNNMTTTKGVVGLLNIPNGNNNISSTSTSYQVFPNNNNNSIGTPMLPPTTPANYLHHPLGSTSSSLMNGNSNQINNGTATPVVYHHHPNQQPPVYATPIHQQHINPNNNGYFTNLSLVTPSTIGTPTAINMLTPGIQQISTPSTIATTPHPNFYTSTVLLNNNNLLNSSNNLKFNPPIMNNNSNSSTVQQNVTAANTTTTTTNNLTKDNQQVISATNNNSFNNNNSLNNNQTINQEVTNTKKQLNDVINNRIESEAAEVLRQFHEVFDNRQQHSSSLTTPIQVLKPTANTTNSSTSTGSKSQQQINNNSKLNVVVDNIIVENNDNNIANNSNIEEKLISPLDTEKIIKRKSELINGIEVSQIERKLTFDEIENVDVNNEINDEKTNDNEPLFTERKEIEKKEEDEEEVCIIIDEEEVVEEIHNNNEEEDEMISKATQRNTSVLSGPIFPTQNRSPDRILSSIPIEEPSITHIYNWCFDFMYSKDNELRVHLYGNTTKNDSEKFYRTSRVTKRIDNRTCETEMSGSIYQLVGDINNETMKKRKHLWDILSEDFIRKFCYCKEDGPFPPNWEELMEQEFERLNKKIDGRRSSGSFTQSSSQLRDNVNQMDEEDLLVDNKLDNETLFQERKRPSLTNTSNHSIKNNSSLMKKKRQEEENNQIANNNDNMEDDEHKDPLFSPRVHSYAGDELGGLNAFEDDMGLGKEKKTSDNEKSEDNMSDDENKNNKKKKETPKKQRGRPPKKKIEEQEEQEEEEEEEENKKKNSKTKGNNNKNDKSTSSLTKRNVSTNSKSLVVETPKKRGRGRPPKNTGLKVSSKMKVSQSTMAKRKDSNSNNKKRKKNETESDEEEEEEEENNEQPSSIHSVSASTRARRRSNEQKKKKKQEEEEEEEEEEEQTPVKSRKKRLEERDAKKKKSNAGRKKKDDDGYSSSSSSVGIGEELEKELIALRGTPKASKIYENVKDLEAEDSYYETHNEKEEHGNYRKENKQVDKNKAEKRDNTKQKETKSGDEKRRKSRIRNQPRKSSKLPPDLSGFIKDDKKDTFDINKLQTKGLGSAQIANFSKLKKSQRKQTVSGTAHILYSILSNSSNSSLSSSSNTNNNIKP